MIRKEFEHAADIERRRIPPTPGADLRLHRLERPVPWPLELQEKMRAYEPSNFYPDYAAFYERLSDFFGIPADRLVVGQGIEGLIRDLFMLCVGPGDVVAMTWPTCAMFGLYARMFGAKEKRFEIPPCFDEKKALAEILEHLPRGTRLFLLPNPGQPVDICFDGDQLSKIAKRCSDIGCILAIDEAYFGFGAPTAVSLAHEFDNVVVLRTFSKAFGAAAIRVGFATAGPQLIRALDGIRQSGEVSGPSIHAATVLMDEYEKFVVPGVKQIVAGRNWLRERVSASGYLARGTTANHVLIDLGDGIRAKGVEKTLLENGVRVRGGFEWPLHRHLLVTAGPLALMGRFEKALGKAIETGRQNG